MENTINEKELKFEQALRQLEDIVERLNKNVDDLDELMRLYEEGVRYLKVCKTKLAEAEMKVQNVSERIHAELGEEEENG